LQRHGILSNHSTWPRTAMNVMFAHYETGSR
jgi:hypothetical protein